MEKRKEKEIEKSDQNAVAELTREGLYKENKWLWEENAKLKEQNGDMFDRIMRDEEYEDSLEEHVRELEEENKNLKEELDKYKKQPPKFSDFGGYDLDSNK